jgi:hypothetical protein
MRLLERRTVAKLRALSRGHLELAERGRIVDPVRRERVVEQRLGIVAPRRARRGHERDGLVVDPIDLDASRFSFEL